MYFGDLQINLGRFEVLTVIGLLINGHYLCASISALEFLCANLARILLALYLSILFWVDIVNYAVLKFSQFPYTGV